MLHMKKTCLKCNAEYEVSQFHFDNGYCRNCQPKFFSIPRAATPAEARSIFYSAIALNLIIMFFSGLIMDGGAISNPLGFFCSATILYLLGRVLLGTINGYPALSAIQKCALLCLPLYGFPPFFICWLLIRKTFFND